MKMWARRVPRLSLPYACGIAARDTFEEAVVNAAEALATHFAVMKTDGDMIPAPRTFEELRHDPEFVGDSADAIVTMVIPRTELAAAE
jgi:predicted RNase H-like HicB family nuclease